MSMTHNSSSRILSGQKLCFLFRCHNYMLRYQLSSEKCQLQEIYFIFWKLYAMVMIIPTPFFLNEMLPEHWKAFLIDLFSPQRVSSINKNSRCIAYNTTICSVMLIRSSVSRNCSRMYFGAISTSA